MKLYEFRRSLKQCFDEALTRPVYIERAGFIYTLTKHGPVSATLPPITEPLKEHKPDVVILPPKLAKKNPELVKQFDKLAEKLPKDNMKFCPNGHPIPAGRNRCMGKACKYS